MPWQEVSTMSLRKEFIMLASQDGANLSELCRRFPLQGGRRKKSRRLRDRIEARAAGQNGSPARYAPLVLP